MARIASVEIFLVDLLPKVVRTDAVQSFERQETPIVRITDSDGAVGVGYSYTIGTGGSAVARLLDEHLAPMLPGREAGDVEGLWRELMYRVHATTVGALTSIALAAIDTALWDLRARRAGLPLHRLAGGAKDRIPLYTTEGGWLHLPTEALVEGALQARADGFHGAKLKVGRPHVAEDVARIAAVREAVGDDWDIMVDANQGFSVPEAIRRARAFEPLDIAWLEEPIHADDVHAHRRLSASTAVPIAVGESLYSLSQFKDYLQSDACSVVQVDVGRIGGITPWLKVAHMAEAYNVPVCPHFLMEIHVALCCAVPNSRWLEYIPQLDLITQSGMRIEDGHGVPSQAPGLGIDWDWAGIERLARHRSRHG
ncbi:mandelate racemase/muconate lactonizing enzyme family protein [Achromobacter sp. 413638]|uniref:mandelate racemase/muconate lactonizing enzyme family protein n=1 Tax=Achromobacter sp. 413638 TaxID=3342385 RepID=UPI00370B90F8